MAILVTMEAHHLVVGTRELIFGNYVLQFFFINFVLLAECRFMTYLTTIEANWNFLVLILTDNRNILITPIFRLRKIGELFQSCLRFRNHQFQMLLLAIRTKWTEAWYVIFANLLPQRYIKVILKLMLFSLSTFWAFIAKTALIIRTWLNIHLHIKICTVIIILMLFILRFYMLI